MNVKLIPLQEQGKETFIRNIQIAFKKAVVEQFGPFDGEIIPRDHVARAFDAVGAESYNIVLDGEVVGGSVLNIHPETNRNELALLFVNVECFQLALGLQDQAGGDLAGADRCHQLFQIGNLADVGRFINQAPDMNRKPTAIHIVRLLTQQVEQLGVDHGNQEIEGGICVGHDEKQGRLFIAQSIQLELVMGGDLPELCNIKGRKAGTAGNQNGFCGLAGCELSIGYLSKKSELAKNHQFGTCFSVGICKETRLKSINSQGVRIFDFVAKRRYNIFTFKRGWIWH